MKKNIFILIILFSLITSCFGMEKSGNSPANHLITVKKNRREKRKAAHIASDDDGYDKEIRQPKKASIQAAVALCSTKKATRMFSCSLCPEYSNPQAKNVRVHILTKHYDNSEVRIKEISAEGTLKRLIEVKNLGKIYRCSECEKFFRVPYYLTAHVKANHSKTLNSNISIEQLPQSVTLQPSSPFTLTTTEVLSPELEPTPLEAQTEQDTLTRAELEHIFGLSEILKNFE